MSEFKVGDEVRVRRDAATLLGGTRGFITRQSGSVWCVSFPSGHNLLFHSNELEHVKPTTKPSALEELEALLAKYEEKKTFLEQQKDAFYKSYQDVWTEWEDTTANVDAAERAIALLEAQA